LIVELPASEIVWTRCHADHTVTKAVSPDYEVTVRGMPWCVDKKWAWHYPWVALLNGGLDGAVLSALNPTTNDRS